MKRIYLNLVVAIAALGSFPALAAPYGMAGCGLGALVFTDQPGVLVGIVGVTLNNIISPQTSAITSGTSNCYDDNGVQNAALYITINQLALAKDISRGNGETLVGLSQVLQCSNPEQLGEALKSNYPAIFPSSDTSANDVTRSIDATIKANPALLSSCKIYS